MALGLGFFVLTSVAGVLGVGLLVGYRNTSELLTQKAQLIIGTQRQQVERYLSAAADQIDFIAGRISSGEVEPEGSEEFVSLLLGAVSATPQILRIQFIDRQQILTGVERIEDETLPIFVKLGEDIDLRHLIDKVIETGEANWGKILWRGSVAQIG